MRTACSSSRYRGVAASVHAGIHPPGMGLETPPGCGPGDTPSGQTDTCKNITFRKLCLRVVKTQSLGEASAVNLKFKAVSPLADPRGYWVNRPLHGQIIFLFYTILEKTMAKIIGWRANL